ncbi:NAD-dependent deacetylase [Helicobacter sp. MIT 99-5507]|uniref:SIR2 family NAD-dependent protein deacylase n=1 Tax=Helicobacter sp. MIT 99-5507 TaxID=152489 RepID=UPI002162E5BC|nr:NAD-dependent deacetylase [Helicobacter sp. MIT 99-5507]
MQKNVMILSGAGLSAASGLKTFRDSGGLWEEYDVMEVCSTQGFKKNPLKVLDFYDERRAQLSSVKPNKAHEIIASIKEKYPNNVHILTQNVDDLLERAGCKDVVHLHGFLPELRCNKCGFVFNIGYESYKDKICLKCSSNDVRHNIVMFGEQAPEYTRLYNLLEIIDLLVVIGTSGEVLPIDIFAINSPKSILNNLDDPNNIAKHFTKAYIQPAISALPKIKCDIDEFMES